METTAAPRSLRIISVLLGLAVLGSAIFGLIAIVLSFPAAHFTDDSSSITAPLDSSKLEITQQYLTQAADLAAPTGDTTTTTAAGAVTPDASFFGSQYFPSTDDVLLPNALPKGAKIESGYISGTVDHNTPVGYFSWILRVVGILLYFWFLFQLNRWVNQLLKGKSDSFWNVGLIRELGFILMGSWVVTLFVAVANALLVRDSTIAAFTSMTDTFFDSRSFWELLGGLFILGFSVILKRGRQLEDELESFI